MKECKITIRFFLNSRNKRKMLNIIKDFSDYTVSENIDDPCFIFITKDSTLQDYKLLIYFWGIIKKYKESSMSTSEGLLTKKQEEDIINWIRCYCNKEHFSEEHEYCFISPGIKSLHGWGCKCLHTIIRHNKYGRHSGISWYKIGPFDGDAQYIDKQDIKEKLYEEAKSKCLSLCPLFSIEKAYKYIKELPDLIDPSNNDNWEYEFSVEDINLRIGVKPKQITIFDLL